MKLWRWHVTIERAYRSSKQKTVTTDPVLRDRLLAFGNGTVVRNMRTGENVAIGFTYPGEISRGVGSLEAQDCHLDDEWVVMDPVLPGIVTRNV